jgi:mercuric reductase
MMDASPRAVRKFIFDHFFETSSPPVLEEVMAKFSLSRTDAFAALKGLEADHHIILIPGTQRILMANPYSAVTTPFRVRIGGRGYYANCAWDTVSLHVMLQSDADVESYCHHCGQPIRLALSKGARVSSDPAEPLIFLSVPVSRWYDNLINTCSNNMVYFASDDHMQEWLAANPSVRGESLTVEKMAQVCRPLSKGRMELGYERPPKDQIVAYWESIGMKGEFWRF